MPMTVEWDEERRAQERERFEKHREQVHKAFKEERKADEADLKQLKTKAAETFGCDPADVQVIVCHRGHQPRVHCSQFNLCIQRHICERLQRCAWSVEA